MGRSCLFVVISFLVAGSLRGQEPTFPYGCRWDNMHSLSCASAGVTTLGDLFVLGQEHRNVPSLPRSPRILKIMKHIDLSYNIISSLHLNVFYKFLSLETLNVSNNHISSVSLNMDEKHTVLTSLQTLVIDRNRLTAIPKGLGKLKSLQTLCLSANRILHIQWDDFTNCTQLHKIDLGGNRITKIHPDAFRDLRNLQVLRLNSNALVSITPLVFLYNHVLRAEIDLSDNLWVCDCRSLSLKHLISVPSMGARKEWNVTCSTPPSRAGLHLLSVEHFHESCQTPTEKYVYARRLIITAGEKTYLHCDISDKFGSNKVFWWTPQGIIMDKSQLSNHYIDRFNNLILDQPEHSDEGLYLCIANGERIVYQVYVQTNKGKPLIRNSRDLQLLNSRMRTQEDFALAVSLSVIFSFLCAFCLGVFLRPYLETLWRRQCKSKDSKENNSAEMYDNEGFTEENSSRRHSTNSIVNSLPEHMSRKDSSSESDTSVENQDSPSKEAINVEFLPKYLNIPNADIAPDRNKSQQCVIDVQVPTRSELHELKDGTYEFIDAEQPDFYGGATMNSSMAKTKRVTWASNENISPKVNLKYVMSLVKPINIIAPDSTMTEIIKSPTQKQFFPSSISKHQKSKVENINNSPHNYYQDNSSSDDGSNEEDHGSDEESKMNSESLKTTRLTWASNENLSPKVNLKHVMSLVKPINIVAPDSTMTEVLKTPKQNQFFPSSISRHSENGKENMDNSPHNHYQDTRLSGGQTEEQLHHTNFENHYSDTNISPTMNREVAQTFYDSSSSDDGSNEEDHGSDEESKMNSELLETTQVKWANNESFSPKVNLKHVMSLVKPINIIAPDSTMTDILKPPKQNQFFPSSISRHSENRKENIGNFPRNRYQDTRISEGQTEDQLHNTHFENHYSDTLISPKTNREVGQIFYDSSSSDDGSNEEDHGSDEDSKMNSELLETTPVTWTSNENVSPKVNLKHVMSLVKPINIIAPDSTTDVLKTPKQNQFFPSSISRHSENRKENIDNFPHNHYQDTRLSVDQTEDQLHNTNFENHYSDTLITPKTNREVGQIFYDNSSSDDGSNEADHGSDEDSKMNSELLETTPVTWTSNENVSPKVNLKHVMSLVRPINIVAPDSTTDVLKTPKQNQFFPSSISRHSENRKENIDNFPHNNYQDTKLSGGQTENKLHNANFENHYSDTLISPKTNREVGQIFYDSSSSDDGSNEEDHGSNEDSKMNSELLETTQVTWTSHENVSPKVNLKHVMSLVKPISIVAPDSMADVLKTPKQNKFFPSSISTHSENRKENIDNSPHNHYQDTRISEDQTEDHLHTTNFENHDSDTLISPKTNREVAQIFYDSSSSDDGSNEENHGPNEHSKMNSELLKPTRVTWTSNGNVSPKVNLKHVMSLVKPINIIAPDSTTDVLKTPKQNQFFPSSISRHSENRKENIDNFPHNNYQDTKLSGGQTENKLHNANFENHYSDTLISPKTNREVGQIFYDSSSSDDGSNEEDHGSNEDSKMNSELLETTQVTWTSHENVSPKVNLKHVMSLVKPISIVAPDSMADVLKTPKQNQFFPSSISRHSENRKENIGNSPHNHNQDTKLSGCQTENQLHNANFENHYSDTLISPKTNREVAQIYYDSSSSDDGSNEEDHGSDEDSKNNSELLETTQVTWANNENVSPKVNLKHVMCLVKPINIVASDSTMTDVLKTSKQSQFFPSMVSRHSENRNENIDNSPHNHYQYTRTSGGQTEDQLHNANFENHYTDTLTSPKMNREVAHIFYDSSLPDDGSTWASSENVSPKVNLKYVMSLIKPINIVVPDSSSVTVQSTSQKQFFQTSISRHAEDRIEIVDNYHYNPDQDFRLTRGNHENKLNNTSFKNYFSNTLKRPKENVEVAQTFYSSSSDDESNHVLDAEHQGSHKGDIVSSDLLKTVSVTRTNNENVSFKVNLRHVMSLLKPINIVSDFTITDVVKSPTRKQFFQCSVSENRMENINNSLHDHEGKTTLSGGQLEKQLHNTNSEDHDSDTVDSVKKNVEITDDSSSDEGSCFSFSQSNSLSDASEQIDIVSDEEVVPGNQSSSNKGEKYSGDIPGSTVFPIPPRNYDDISVPGLDQEDSVSSRSQPHGDADNYFPKREWLKQSSSKTGESVTEFPNVVDASGTLQILSKNTTQWEEWHKEFPGSDPEPNTSKDILQWTNISTNDDLRNDFPPIQSHAIETTEKDILSDAYTRKWNSEPLSISSYESQSFLGPFSENKIYIIPDIGETSTDGNFMDFNIYGNNSFKPLQVGMQRGTSATVNNPGRYFVKRKKVFDAFSESLKSGQN